MLDQLTRGRLELGIGRGTSPHEMAVFNVDAARVAPDVRGGAGHHHGGADRGQGDVYRAALRGARRRADGAAVQRPYPPLWYPTSNVESVPWVAGQGISTMFSSQHADAGADPRERRRVLARVCGDAERAGPPERPRGRAEGRADAPGLRGRDRCRRDARGEGRVRAWFENYTYLWALHGNTARHEHKADLETAVADRRVLVGAPATVRALRAGVRGRHGRQLLRPAASPGAT